MNAAERERLFNELLELYYDCHADPEPLLERLTAEPELQELFTEVKLAAVLIDEAARSRAPELALRAPQPRRPLRVLRSWRTVAALLLACAVALPFLMAEIHDWRRGALESSTLRLVVSGPPAAPDTATVACRIETWTLSGQPRPAAVRWRVVDAAGAEVLAGGGASTGALDVRLPPRVRTAGTLEVVATADGSEERASLSFAGGQSAPLAHLTVDKPVYRPGETVLLRAVLLDRLTLSERPGSYRFRVVDGRKSPVQSFTAAPQDGAVGARYLIPEDAAGGNYAFEFRDDQDQFAIESIGFLVRRFQPPRLAKTIDLDRETYAPGATGTAVVTVLRLAGGAGLQARIEASLVLDGATVWQQEAAADGAGKATFEFTIPWQVERGDARFVARVSDRGVVETAIEPFVVPTGEVTVAFFPEGGDLVAGVENRVYAQVEDPLGRPLSARGHIVDSSGRTVAEFSTEHQGRGRFEVTPRAGERYRLEFDEPQAQPVELPAARAGGAVLRALADSYRPGHPLGITAQTLRTGPWMLGVFCRGLLVANDTFSGAGEHRIDLDLPEQVAGVLRVTLFDETLQPVAERLVHRSSGRALVIGLEPADPSLTPGEHQAVSVVTTDERGNPVPAVVGLTVTDRAVRDLLGETRVGLADQTWLAADVGDLEDAGEFFGDNFEAHRNVDLLLGTLGWRRFAWADAATLVAEHGQEARALLAREARAQTPQVIDSSHADREALTRLERNADRAREIGVTVAAVIGLLLILGGLAWLAARLTRALLPNLRFAPPLAATLAVSVPVLLIGLLYSGSRILNDAVPGVILEARFAADAPAPMARFLLAGEDLDGAVGNVWDGAVLEGQGRARVVAAGVFFDDGLEGDLRGRPERAFGLVAEVMDEFEVEEQKLEAGDLARWDERGLRELRHPAFLVREFRHTSHRGPFRDDFQETVYWNAGLPTGADGKAEIEFDVSDSVTTWSVIADAHGAGRVGQGTAEFEARIPFRMEPVLPQEVTQGDRLQLPVALICDDPEIESVRLHADAGGPLRFAEDPDGEVAITAGGGRWLIPIDVTGVEDGARITLQGDARRWGDRVEHAIRVVPRGFPQKVSASGLVKERAEFAVTLPESVAPGSLVATLKLYPSPLATILDGMQGILREPCGCFEQASSSNYPNVMAMAYLQAAGDDDPAFMGRAGALLHSGYAKIAGYECGERGYEWFGQNPGHEALTAYGLLEFHDMAKVHPVDPEMVARTRQWLLDRRDGKGGYERNERALDSFGRAPKEVTDAYVTYALAATGNEPAQLSAELDRLARRAAGSDDPYEVALAASALFHGGRFEAADRVRDRLKTMQRADGALAGTTTSITSSRGANLEVETTGFAILAWLVDPADAAHVERALTFLLGQRSAAGTFGATQATIVALKALTAFAEASRTAPNDGELTITVNGRVAHREQIRAGQKGTLLFDWMADELEPGESAIVIELTGGNEFPYAFDLDYHADQPADHADGAVEIETALGSDTVAEGATVPLAVTVRNRTDDGVPMTLCIVGLPAGLFADSKVLDDLQEAGYFDLWEIRGRELILYWRGLAPRAERKLSIDLVARIPGRTTGPASRAYLYYTDDQKRWAEPLSVTVTPAR